MTLVLKNKRICFHICGILLTKKEKNNFVRLDLANKGIDIYKGKSGDRGIDFLYRLVLSRVLGTDLGKLK